jgi:flagellar motility protein MotE (MotC chaperone)
MEERSIQRKVGSFLFFWGMTFLFAIILVALLLKFMGMPVGQTFMSLGNQVPVLNSILPEAIPLHVEAKEEDNSNYWQEEHDKRVAELKEKEQTITELNDKLTASQKGLEELNKKQLELQSQLETKQSESTQKQIKQIASIYENMSSSKAAKVFEVMPLEEAAATIMYLNVEQQSSILGSMKDTQKAADITMIMKEIALIPDTNQLTINEKIQELSKAKQTPIAAISETITKMPAAQSATIIQNMMETNSEVAMDIINDVSVTIRSQILSELANKDAKLAAKITADLNN